MKTKVKLFQKNVAKIINSNSNFYLGPVPDDEYNDLIHKITKAMNDTNCDDSLKDLFQHYINDKSLIQSKIIPDLHSLWHKS